ncbi:hypothetical protein QCN29_15035 [Streptomyces sp. HNM0663]|uniref:Uncharacterized protein n=1 Tax=Streptomyces chengmaiensis TaxID=3040919 RepID=A0ABT6HMZ5_9ACTN|nr:hypothetical protein [Streptomyces chengmaiensis]MDH2390082.1 hypothetical protein [Streptomyces chengmaiensis]
MNDTLIPVAETRATQNRRLELLGLDPVSETEYENMRHRRRGTPELPHPVRATFEQIAAIDWDNVPVDGDDHSDARALAGRIRDINEYYAPENTHLRSIVEGWLTDYSAAHTYREEN